MKSLLVFCLLPILTATSLAATPQYSPRQDIVTGFTILEGMAVADFNGDGRPDIAATDLWAKRVYIYLNDGKGGFGIPKSMDIAMAASGPGAIMAGDFNEDGKQDLIIATISGYQSDLQLLGNGDGTFTQQPDLLNSFGFVTGVPIDINRDHHLDLILGGNGSLSLYLGDGRGDFQNLSLTDEGYGLFTGVTAGDFNKDGKLDFVAASPIVPASLNTFLGNGDGTYSSPIGVSSSLVNSKPTSVATADLNGDGNPDLLLGAVSVGAVFLGKGDGTFDTSKPYYLATPSAPVHAGSFGSLVAAADMDGDQKADAVVADDNSRTINVFLNDGTGTFPQSTPDFSAAVDPGSAILSVADLNGDGLPDIVVANNITQKIFVFLSINPKTPVIATLTSSANPQLVNSSVTFIAKIADTTGNVPTGTVTLMEETNSLGQQTLDSNGEAAFSLSSLATGQHTLSANYSGDGTYAASVASIIQSVTDFQMSSPTASQTVAAGKTAFYNVTVTPLAGLAGTLTVTCSQLPALTSCDPLTVPLNGQPVTATLNVHTTAPVQPQHTSSVTIAGFGFVSLLLTAFLPFRRRIYPRLALGIAAFVLIGMGIGCSSGSSKSPGTASPGTPSGSSSFIITSTITQSGQTLTHSTPATLIVQ